MANNRDKNGKLYSSQIKAVTRYSRDNYDRTTIRYGKGEKADLIKRAERLGYSFNQLVVEATYEMLERLEAERGINDNQG